MKQSVILVNYIGVGNLSDAEVDSYIKKSIENLKPQKEYDDIEVISYYIPTRGETKIECVYPTFLLQDELKEKYNVMLDNMNKFFKQQLNKETNE